MKAVDRLQSVTIENFRCFADHRVDFPTQSLIVGKNNAGKSTLVEALRLVSLVTERQHGLQFKAPPRDLALPPRLRGFQPGLDAISIRKGQLFYRYGSPPAKVSARFLSGSEIHVYIGDGFQTHAIMFDATGRSITSRQELSVAAIPRISILPQVGPLELEEKRLSDAYVRASLYTSRSSLHFRNQLALFAEHYASFKRLVEQTWPGLQVLSLERPPITDREQPFALLLRDHDFSAEVGWMGHGLQMWLQAMWFLCRSRNSNVLILDEPDVYMHADLQRRLIRMLTQDGRQYIIATHSPEMLAEAHPESVIVLDRNQPASKTADSSEAVQALLRSVGSVHNLTLARLSIHKKLILVEGNDLAYLKLFQNVLDPQAQVPVDALPNVDIGGWSQWAAAVDIARIFRKSVGGEVEVVCLLDRDYHSDAVLDARREEARSAGVVLKIWEGKEIENYVIHAAAIARAVCLESDQACQAEDIEFIINQECEALREETVDTFSQVISQRERKGPQYSNPLARKWVTERWGKLGGAMVVSGKQLFKNVSERVRESSGVSLSMKRVIRAMHPLEVHAEVSNFIKVLTTRDGKE